MRIAQVAPLAESVPPKFYGGTERVVAFLDKRARAAGSRRDAVCQRRFAHCARLSRRGRRPAARRPCDDVLAPHLLMLEEVLKRAPEFDMVHFHISQFHFPVARRMPVAHVTTLHGRLDLPELPPLYAEFEDMPVVSISDAQRDTVAACRVGRNRVSRPATRPAAVSPGAWSVPGIPRPHLAGEARRSRDRDRDRLRAAVEDRRQGRPRRSGLLRAGDSTSARPSARSNSSARSASLKKVTFSATPAHCSSPSTGRSHSGS